MKKFVLTACLYLAFFAGFAQFPCVAMLDHNDTLTAFYGPSALRQAYAVADTGDIITLSPGLFYSQDMGKPRLTVRGAGMFSDSLAGTDRTHIQGDFSLLADSVTLEGLYCPNSVDHGRNVKHGGLLRKCYLGQLYVSNSIYYTYDLRVYQCVIAGNCYTGNMINCQFMNCFIGWINGTNATGMNALYNCTAGMHPDDCINMITKNCVLWAEVRFSASYVSSDYCIGVNPYCSSYYGCFDYYASIPSAYHLYNIKNYDAVFKVFKGTYTEGMNMELQDSIATKYLGNDSTQIGMFGGANPFNSYMDNRRVNVPVQTKSDGKLEVEIKAVKR